jgi:hypothetical protein
MKSFKLILSAALFFACGTASALEIDKHFDKMSGKYKQPFGPNMMQQSNRRISYNRWADVGGSFIFQAAFRSDMAKDLLAEHGMYTGNLFATNYYELRAEFLKGDANADNLSSTDDLSALLLVSKTEPLVFERAKQMVQNWNLEKLYILKNPSSRFARSFQARGVGGAEFEQEYGREFTNFYIESSASNIDLMPIISLVSSSALVDSSSFTKIRNMATSLYETYRPGGSKGHLVSESNLRRIKGIRDSIHNQLTPDIVRVIDEYMSETRSSAGHSELESIKRSIESYFAQGVSDIKHIAKQGGLEVNGLDAIDTRNPELADLMTYGAELVANRQMMLSDQVILENKYLVLSYTSVAASFLARKVSRYIDKNDINASNIGEVTLVATQILYIQGLINNPVVAAPAEVPADYDDYELLVDDMLTEVVVAIQAAYNPYMDKWKQVDSRLSGIMDDTVRASSITLLEEIMDKMD